MDFKMPLFAVGGILVGAFLAHGVPSSRTAPVEHRFVDAGGPVLDTKTGQYCNPGPKQTNELPLCHDLYLKE